MNDRIRRYFRHGRLSELAVFEASARLGCYTAAARELHLAQPTVSAQIRKLSESLGMPLFEQVGKRMHPTEAGRCLEAACAEVLGAFGRLEDSLARLRDLDAGRLALATTTWGGRIASRMVGNFARHHPGLDVTLHIHNRAVLLERMGRDEDDLYLFATPPEEGVVSQRILAHPVHVLAPSTHALASACSIPFARIANEPFIARERGSGTRRRVEAIFRQHGAVPHVRLELPTNEAVEEAVRAGAGIAILPRTEPMNTAGLAVLDVQGFPLEGHLHLSYPVGKALAPAARAFLDFARR
jgi:LysR family transcriptional regulator, low CO2-responsive transcriptional regulator